MCLGRSSLVASIEPRDYLERLGASWWRNLSIPVGDYRHMSSERALSFRQERGTEGDNVECTQLFWRYFTNTLSNVGILSNESEAYDHTHIALKLW